LAQGNSQELSKIVSALLKEYDFAHRYGGDEFIVILPDVSQETIKIVGEQIIQKFSKHNFLKRKKIKVIVSKGMTSVNPKHLKGPDQMIAMADQALCQAKEAGKNRLSIISQHL
jgi:diguanylate cyclase (GGDEF)-like protein